MNPVREALEERLASYLVTKSQEAEGLASEATELVEAVKCLTLRGGKRMRPMVLAAGYHAISPEGRDDLSYASAALELLQTYLLIHDDWMDRDEQRRGGQAVWATLRDRHNNTHLGASLAVLAGDLASAYASELMTASPCPKGRNREALDCFWRIQREVFFGQHLDLIGHRDVERMYDLKTGSYTVRGPLRLGAVLADASTDQLAALDRIARPLGVAFQLRDELLGTFGNPDETGKPAGNDIRAGKLTVLVAEAQRLANTESPATLCGAWGRHDASDEAVHRAVEWLSDCGARAHVEKRLATLVNETSSALEAAPFRSERLESIVSLLVDRDR